MPAKKTTKATTKTAARRKTTSAANGTGATAPAAASTRRGRGRELVIVESPAKARTLAGILGSGYEVTASVGHVRDLPRSKLGVDVDNEFEPHYIVPREKRDVVNKIREAAAKATTVYLATDPDREGEAISWHLVQAAGLDQVENRQLHRVVFHEITPGAIRDAFEHPRDIDLALVDAQQARRILDRLVGYKISPLLWRKVRRGLSAGRVQSAAVKMVVDREREVLGFTAKEYWSVDALLAQALAASPVEFAARLRGKAGQRTFELNSDVETQSVSAQLRDAAYAVKTVRRRDQHRRPAPPFTTSTLQQEASRRFGFTARRTMALAQQLYEGIDLRGSGRVGLITYMRTDSTNLADVAVAEIRAFVAQRFGGDFVPAQPRVYRSRKGAQEAHEAIRATSVTREPNSAELRGLNPDLRRLYTLIWQRGVACQMADAVLDSVSVDIDAAAKDGDVYHLRASASAVRFPGYRQLYEEARDDVTAEEGEQQLASPLPEMNPGDALTLRDLKAEQHFTEPPPRYTEATLVKALEENGIGRPSTYAPIMSTIQDRGYVEREQRQLKPTELGFVVNDFLNEQFPNVVDLRYTADMEEELDEIASGSRPWQPTVRELYNPLNEALISAEQAPKVVQETGEHCPECEKPLVRRFGRFGPFFACTGFPECRYTRPDGDQAEPEATDEKCDVCGAAMVVKRGRFGSFYACTKYPECKGTKPVLLKTGVLCPVDQGEVVERMTRQKRKFYGCMNYPNCDFTSWQKPLPGLCPSCKGLLVTNRNRARCTACGWQGAPAEALDVEKRVAGTPPP
ncbi:MAG TPA: type I DNA topoisomerase, partial [Dehalococcoidia bacterium]|nr:type I DNA topoisomerase [Dehalococcoidia bacterium]